VHALSDSGSHICKKERRPGRTPKRLATTKISMRSDLHTPFAKSRGREAQFLFFSGTNRYKACYGQRNATFSTNSRFKTSQVSWKFFLVFNPHSEKVSAKETCKHNMPVPVLIVQKIWKLAPPNINPLKS